MSLISWSRSFQDIPDLASLPRVYLGKRRPIPSWRGDASFQTKVIFSLLTFALPMVKGDLLPLGGGVPGPPLSPWGGTTGDEGLRDSPIGVWLSQPLLPYALFRVGSCCPTPCPSLTLPHATLGGEPGVAQVYGCSPGGVPFLTPLTGEGSLKAPSPCPLFPWLPYTE